MIRPARPEDRPAIIDIIDTCLREIDDQLFLDGEGRDVTNVESAYVARGGAFVVLESDGEVIGTHATLPVKDTPGLVTFRRLYLRQNNRGRGHGRRLMQWAIDWSRDHGFREIAFWSDIRFTRAHRFFESFGFERGEMREMNDTPLPYSEYRFRMRL
jgi:putative acetyltransferase